MNKKYYIYKIVNNLNQKIYIGKHSQDTNKIDNYFGSGVLLKKAIEKYGKNNFTKEIVEYCDDLLILSEKEIFWIQKYNSFAPNGYNLAKGGNGGNSTTNTHIYNNGTSQIFIKENETIPNGYKKGAIPHTIKARIKMSKNTKGKNKNKVPWNKNLDINNKKVFENSQKAKETTIKTGILRGANNPRAKKFLFISPDGERIEIFGNVKQFCKINNFSYVTVKKYKNKGVIPYRKNCNSVCGNNLTGWEIKTIICDSVKESRKCRLQHRLTLLQQNKLTKRQKTISKIKPQE